MRQIVLILILLAGVVTRLYFACDKPVVTFITFSQALQTCSQKSRYDSISYPGVAYVTRFRQYIADRVEKSLPSPESELFSGMTVGIDNLFQIPNFKQNLKNTGTIHVVVVSGFNISLVSNAFLKSSSKKYKLKSLMLAWVCTLIYAVVSGFEPPVVRAWVMNLILTLSTYYGRSLDPVNVIVITALFILLANPLYVFSLSLILSYLCILSIVLYADIVCQLVAKVFGKSAENMFINDFSSTVSAQILVTPLIASITGKFSLLAFLVNPLILWLVPLSTVAGLVMLPLLCVDGLVSFLPVFIVFPLLHLFCSVINFFGTLEAGILNVTIPNWFLVVYYIVTISVGLYLHRGKKYA